MRPEGICVTLASGIRYCVGFRDGEPNRVWVQHRGSYNRAAQWRSISMHGRTGKAAIEQATEQSKHIALR